MGLGDEGRLRSPPPPNETARSRKIKRDDDDDDDDDDGSEAKDPESSSNQHPHSLANYSTLAVYALDEGGSAKFGTSLPKIVTCAVFFFGDEMATRPR